MKKIIILGVICVIAAACISCGHVDPASRYPHMVADIDPYPIGSTSVTFGRFFSSGVKEDDVDLIFYPRENEVALEFRYELIRYRQFWNEADRQRFIDALSRYNADFDGRNLDTRYSKSRGIYGRFKSKIEWETFTFTATYRASPTIELGYRFREDAPYFSVLQHSAKEESGLSGSNMESLQYSLYFTRAQAAELARLFDKTYLLGTLEGRVPRPVESSGKDVYTVEQP